MNHEERLNRLEEFGKRLAIHGRRARNDLRTNVNALIDAQIRNEYLFNERYARLSAAQDRTDGQIKELVAAQRENEREIKEIATTTHKEITASHRELVASQKELAASQKQTDEKLRVLIDIIGRDRNGTNNYSRTL